MIPEQTQEQDWNKIQQIIWDENRQYLSAAANPKIINIDQYFIRNIGPYYNLQQKIISTYFQDSDNINLKLTLNLNSEYQLPVLIIEDITEPSRNKIFLLLAYMNNGFPCFVPNIPESFIINNQTSTIIDGTYVYHPSFDPKKHKYYMSEKKNGTTYIYDHSKDQKIKALTMYFNGSSDSFIYNGKDKTTFLRKFHPTIENIESKVFFSYDNILGNFTIIYRKTQAKPSGPDALTQKTDTTSDKVSFVRVLDEQEYLQITLQNFQTPLKRLPKKDISTSRKLTTNAASSELIFNKSEDNFFYGGQTYNFNSHHPLTYLSLDIQNTSSHIIKARMNDQPKWQQDYYYHEISWKNRHNTFTLNKKIYNGKIFYELDRESLSFTDKDGLTKINLSIPETVNLFIFNTEQNKYQTLEFTHDKQAACKTMTLTSLQRDNQDICRPKHNVLFDIINKLPRTSPNIPANILPNIPSNVSNVKPPEADSFKIQVQGIDLYGSKSRLASANLIVRF